MKIIVSSRAPKGRGDLLKDCFASLAMTLVFFPPLGWASVASEVNRANNLYKHGQFDDAIRLYKNAAGGDQESSVVKYDLGTALYKKGDYTKAMDYLQQSAQDKNVIIKKKAEYNLGNVLYKSGIQKANANVEEAIKSLTEALGHYGQTLTLDPKDSDAQFNEDFVKKEIERLKQEKQQQQQQQGANQQQQRNQRQQQQNQQNQGSQQKQKAQQNKYQKGQQSRSQAQKKSNRASGSQENQKELDRKQAQGLLEDYQNNEEPKKLLNYMPKKIDDKPVLKDW